MFYRRNHNQRVPTKSTGYFGKKGVRLNRVGMLAPGSILRVSKEYDTLVEVSYGKTELISRYELEQLCEKL